MTTDPAARSANASVAPVRRGTRLWLVTAAAAVVAAVLLVRAWTARGTLVEVRFSEGHGLRVGDPLKNLGIAIGRVESVRLAEEGGGIVVGVRVERDAATRLGEGSRFWIVRPRVDLGGVGGLDTLVGPRYLEVQPAGEGSPRTFAGLDEMPVVEDISPEDRLVTLVAEERGTLARGAGIYHRGIRVGRVLDLRLAPNGGGVEAEAWIAAEHADLVREKSRFHSLGAVQVELSLEGLRTRIDSLDTLLVGGVALVVPPAAGEPVANGQVFALDRDFDGEW